MSTAAAWQDERIAAGLTRQLEALTDLERSGASLIGWKVGLGAPAAMQRAGISAPLVGFLTSRTREHDGAAVPIGAWAHPVLEPELAVWMGEDVPGDASLRQAAGAIAGIGAAIELADVDRPLEEVEEIVAGNVFHRSVILGPASSAHAGGNVEGISVRVTRDGAQVASTQEPTALTGDLAALTAHVAGWLAAAGRGLCAGQVLIAGSVVPIIDVRPGDRVLYDCRPLGTLSVSVV